MFTERFLRSAASIAGRLSPKVPVLQLRRRRDGRAEAAVACATDLARRRGPHLYLKFSAAGKTHSVYVLPEQREAIKDAHRAWLRFQEIGAQIAAGNRARFLLALEIEIEKQKAKAKRACSRKKALK